MTYDYHSSSINMTSDIKLEVDHIPIKWIFQNGEFHKKFVLVQNKENPYFSNHKSWHFRNSKPKLCLTDPSLY